MEHRAAMRHWLAVDPDQAIAASLSLREWAGLPPDLRTITERPLSTIAEVGIKPDCSGGDHAPATIVVRADGARWTGAATRGWNGRPSKLTVPVNGIELDGSVALRDEPLLELPADELTAALAIYPESPRARNCVVTGQPWDGSTAALIGGRIHFFSSPEARTEVGRLFRLAVEKPGPHNARPLVLALNGGGPLVPDDAGREIVRLASEWTLSPKSVLGLVLKFSTREPPVAPSGFLSVLTDVSGWINQSSHGRTSLVPTVPPQTFELPRSAAYYYNESNGEDDLADHAEQLARAAGYEPADYDIRIFLFPRTSFDWAGLATVGGEHQWLNGEWDTGLVAHETGHNYGLYHASSWNATGGSILPATGTGNPAAPEHDEYGDPFTVMGDTGSYPAGEFHQYAMAQLSWIAPGQVVTADKPGTYRVYRFDHPTASDSPLLALKLNRAENQSLWLGYRQRFPQLTNGVTLVWNYSESRTRLLDLTPDSRTGTADLEDAALQAGSTFADPSGQLYVTPVATGGTAPYEWIDVGIGFTQAGNREPVATILPVSGAYTARSPLGFSAEVSDPDGDSLTWLWDFGSGFTSTEPSPVMSFAIGGTHTVRLTVSDGRGGVATDSLEIHLKDPLLLWSPEPTDELEPGSFTAAVWGANRFVAAGGTRLFSAPALPGEPAGPWTVQDIGLETAGIAWRNGVFVAAGSVESEGGDARRAAVATSPDGVTWTEHLTLPFPPLRSIAAGPAGFVCAGDQGTLIRSENGTDWTALSSGTGLSLTGIAFAGPEGVAVGDEEMLLRSSDGGLTWRDRSGLDGLDGWYWTGAAAAEGRLFAWDGMDLYVTSGDSAGWTKASGVPPETDPAGIVWKDGVFVAAAGPRQTDPAAIPAMLLASEDGIFWRHTMVGWQAAPVALIDAGGTLRAADRGGEVRRQIPPATPGLDGVPRELVVYRAAGAPAAPATVHVAATGEATVGWSLTGDREWLRPQESSGIARLTPQPVVIEFHTEALPAGTHRASLAFSSSAGPSFDLPVTLHLYHDDHGDTPSAATSVLPELEYPGQIEVPGDNDWFTITIDRPGILIVRTKGGLDTLGELHHSSGTIVASNDDNESDPADRNFLLYAEVQPGTWHIRVTSWENTTGSYRLIPSFTPAGPPFRITAVRIAPGGGLEVTFPSIPGRTYSAQTALAPDGPWLEIPGTSRKAEGSTTTITAPVSEPPPPSLFVRIVNAQ